MKPSTFFNLSFGFLFASILFLSGCSKDDEIISKTNLLCRTWETTNIEGSYKTLNFNKNGTGGSTFQNGSDHFQSLWKWSWLDKEETILVITNSEGIMEHATIVQLTEKFLEFTYEDEKGKHEEFFKAK